MSLSAEIYPYTLDFKFPAGTSRGVLRDKTTYLIKVFDSGSPEVIGWGECGPLNKLSIDDVEDIEEQIIPIVTQINDKKLPSTYEEVYELAFELAGYKYPSLRFGIETALLDLMNGGERRVFNNSFFNDQESIPINGLIWMGHMEAMLLQISDKVVEGFDCIKMKVGSLDFEKEVDILNYIRRKYYDQEILLRVDANGAFKPEEALYKMNAMAKYHIHSIEQPIKAGQHELMASLCKKPPIDIALDEELIGIESLKEKRSLLEYIKPQYIIIKPTLLGGFQSSMEWINLANELGIGWWITSALESNIGLNAICQFSLEVGAKSYQGLGTGQLYHNNFESPLTIERGKIFYDKRLKWNLSVIRK